MADGSSLPPEIETAVAASVCFSDDGRVLCGITPASRRELIARAAYYLAEKRHFESGCEMQDWIEAEAEVDRVLQQTVAAHFSGGAG